MEQEILNEEKKKTENYHSVGYVSKSARKPLGIVAHGPSSHVFRQSLKHLAAACCLGDCSQHGTHLCSSGPGKRSSWVRRKKMDKSN